MTNDELMANMDGLDGGPAPESTMTNKPICPGEHDPANVDHRCPSAPDSVEEQLTEGELMPAQEESLRLRDAVGVMREALEDLANQELAEHEHECMCDRSHQVTTPCVRIARETLAKVHEVVTRRAG